MSDDLVKRLRDHIAVSFDDRGHVFEDDALCDDAADRIEELEAKLKSMAMDNIAADLSIEMSSDRIKELEAKLAKSVDALGEAIYLLDPDEEDIAKETGLYRIVTTYAELTGGKDE